MEYGDLAFQKLVLDLLLPVDERKTERPREHGVPRYTLEFVEGGEERCANVLDQCEPIGVKGRLKWLYFHHLTHHHLLLHLSLHLGEWSQRHWFRDDNRDMSDF